MKIKTGDKVIAISGKNSVHEKREKRTGKVLSADPKAGKVVVQGLSVATHHRKPKKQGEEGGIMKQETPIYACKVMLVCPKCDKPTRVGHTFEGKKKLRQCKNKNCGATFV